MARLLLVDDDQDVRDTTAEALEADGFSVVSVDSGYAALKRLAENGIVLVITDILMPGMDGIELIRRLKQKHDKIKILAISGGGAEGPESLLDKALKLGVDAVLSKPFSRTELRSSVTACIGAAT